MSITAKVAAAAVLAMAVAFGDADGTWVKRTGVGTGGTDWTSWNEPQNWQDGTVAFGATGGTWRCRRTVHRTARFFYVEA